MLIWDDCSDLAIIIFLMTICLIAVELLWVSRYYLVSEHWIVDI